MSDDDASKAGASMEAGKAAGRGRLLWPVIGVALLTLQVGTASAGGDDEDFTRHGFGNGVLGHLDARICRRHNLSEETLAWCDSIAGLIGRDLYKATAAEYLRSTNQPPVAELKLDRLQPDRLDLNALDSWDEDGFPHIFYWRLEDAATGEVVAGPVTTREPVASLRLNGKRPERIRAFVVVEDDERALHEAELEVDLPASCGSSATVSCFPQGGAPEITTCYPTFPNFTTIELLDAARRCNANITASTPVVFAAAGAAGGRGADVWPNYGGPGGAGGLAAMGTTLEHLDDEFGSSASYCYGLGQAGGHTDTASGAGGASTLLRTCYNVSQMATTGVLLIAGGGGGGTQTNIIGGDGLSGGAGGVAYSGTGGPCPGDCIPASGPAGQGGAGDGGGSGGSTGIGGNDGGGCQAGANGNDGIGGAGGFVPGFGTAYWAQGTPVVATNVGQGGQNCHGSQASYSTPSGGGGYGGGGAGGWLSGPDIAGGGGGGGGSFAAQSTLDNIDPSQWSRSAGGGWIYILFGPQP